jgi:hypothetical protein
LVSISRLGVSQSIDKKDEILERLDRLERQNRELLEQIKLLRQELSAESKITQPTPATVQQSDGEEIADTSIPDRVEVVEHRVEEQAQTKVESSQKFPIQLTGMALFNAFHNGPYSGTAQYPFVAGLERGRALSGGSFRQSIVGLNFHGPTTVWGGKVSGTLFLDLFGGSGQALDQLVRLRIAKIQVDWPNTSVFFGQDKPLVSQREPDSLAQVGISPLTAAGNPWLWVPQVRLEQRLHIGPKWMVRGEAALLQTNEGSAVTYGPSGLVEPYRPAFQGRLSARYKWGEDKYLEIGSGAHTSTSHYNGFSVPSRLYTADWFIKPGAHFEWKGLFFRGRNFANLGALGGLDHLSTVPIAVAGTGGWTEFRYLPTQRLSFNLYGGQQDDRNSVLDEGRIGKNQAYAVNMIYLLAPNVVGSFEFGQIRTSYIGSGVRLNNHYDLAIGYMF